MAAYLHIDMDSFYVSVERVLDPSLEGKPVMVGGAGRGVVTSASYEARQYGVRSAMPGFQARRLCPDGIFVPGRRGVYSEFSKKVFDLLRSFSPDVRAYSIDEGLVNLTGTEKLMGHPVGTAHEIIGRIRQELGLPSSGGLATHPTLAKIAATAVKPRGLLYVPPGSEERFLGPLDVSVIPGVGPKTHRELVSRGVATVAQLLAHPRLGKRYLNLERGGDAHHAHEHSIGSETTLWQPLTEPAAMEQVLGGLVGDVAARLRRQSSRARRITVKIRYSDFKTITRSRTLKAPTCFDVDILKVACELLAGNLTPGRPVRLLGISTSGITTEGWQDSIFDYRERASMDKLYKGIDTLQDKYGKGTVTLGAGKRRSD
ncbi:MAG: DNA polymerase IV [Deltaproteobacteria bacterium]|nr:DNA polymerase IV [Deltaproteobacteria bacterium]